MGPIGRANLQEACAGLLAAKQRTVLALIGIVIGVASVSAMLSVGTIVRGEAVRPFQELGTDIVNVRLRARDQRTGPVSVGLQHLAEAPCRGVAALRGGGGGVVEREDLIQRGLEGDESGDDEG